MIVFPEPNESVSESGLHAGDFCGVAVAAAGGGGPGTPGGGGAAVAGGVVRHEGKGLLGSGSQDRSTEESVGGLPVAGRLVWVQFSVRVVLSLPVNVHVCL